MLDVQEQPMKRIEKAKKLLAAIDSLTPDQPCTSLDDTIDGEIVCFEVVSVWKGKTVKKIIVNATLPYP